MKSCVVVSLAESKESKVMVMVDIFWYLTLLVGSELRLLVMQIVHNLYMD
jgi:hypothetical protein